MAGAGGEIAGFARMLLEMNDLTEVKVGDATTDEAKTVLAEIIVEHLAAADLSDLKTGGFTSRELETLSNRIRKLSSEVLEHSKALAAIATSIAKVAKQQLIKTPAEPARAAAPIAKTVASMKVAVDHRLETALEQAVPRIRAVYAKMGKGDLAPAHAAEVKKNVSIYPEGMISTDNWISFIARAIKDEDGNIKRISFLIDAKGNITHQTEDWSRPGAVG